MSWFKKWSVLKPPQLAEETEWNFKYLKAMPEGLTVDDVRASIDKLHAETRRIKREGVSVWNAKAVIPKVFDVVDGAFVAMKEVVDKMAEQDARITELEKKE